MQTLNIRAVCTKKMLQTAVDWLLIMPEEDNGIL